MAKQDFMNALMQLDHANVALGAGTSIACLDLMEKTQSFFPEAHLDSEKMALLAQAGHAVVGLDVVMPLFSVCHETEALGCKVDWGKPDQMPYCKDSIYADPEDIAIPRDLLQKRSCQAPLEAIKILKKRLGHSAAVCGKAFGPWTLGYHLFGIENFLIDTIADPSKIRKIIEVLSDVTIAFANAQIEAGADCILLGDHATADLCSPAAYKQFLKETHGMLAQKINAPVILHICGNTIDRIGMIAQTGISCFHWDTKSGPPDSIRQLAGPKMALMGGVSNSLLLMGKPDEITLQAQQAAEAGINIIGPECAIPLKTPLANLKAIAAIRKGLS
jgi:[methyl-Co(III) methanol-specific corrinoid protein]:coenzyme M methyltransferase